jgi:hypothetical protein
MRAIRPRTRPDSREHVVTIDTDSAPRIMFYGENFLLEDLPVGTRVIYPKRPITGVANPQATIRYALNHPEGMDPLHALLKPGMKVTVAIDDISMPLPIMRTPDVRQLVLEIVCEMLADHGVDDVHLVIALALHRRMTDSEIKRMVGPKIWDEYWPDRLYNHDACDPDGMVVLGKTRHGELVEVNRRAAESDLVIYVNMNFVPMNGGHKSMGVGLCGYESLKAHHTPKMIADSNSYMNPPDSAISHSMNRQGAVVESHLKVFHIETVLNNRTFDGPLDFLMKNEDDFTEADRLKFQGMKWALDKLPFAARREIFMRTPAAYELIACTAGACEPVHDKTLPRASTSTRRGRGPGRHPHHRHPLHLAVQRQLEGAQPAARAGDGARLLLPHVPGQAGAARRRRPHHRAPVLGQVRPGPPPELHRVLQPPAARDHGQLHAREEVPGRVRLQPELRRDVPARQRLPRRPPVLHVVLGPARPRAGVAGDRRRRRQHHGADADGLGDRRHDGRGHLDGPGHDGPEAQDHDAAPPADRDLRRA